ncbi:MAG: ATP-binding cassette domain-containing protein, partial [Polyangiaceae bacterium]
VSVMRAGKIVARYATAQTNVEELARAMVGGELPALAQRSAARREEHAVIAISGLRARTDADALEDVSLEVHAGEIVGIAGVEGNGQSALADALAGVAPYEGVIRFSGAELGPSVTPRQRLANGIRMIPQDRQHEALVLNWSVADNAILGQQRRSELRRGPQIDRNAGNRFAQEIVERFDVRPARIDVRMRGLSGGNQQKVVVGRALVGKPAFVLAHQPTRGVDVGAATLVQSRLIEARNAGTAILLISLELDEIFALSDRILVLFRGKVVGEFPRERFDRARIGALMAGSA